MIKIIIYYFNQNIWYDINLFFRCLSTTKEINIRHTETHHCIHISSKLEYSPNKLSPNLSPSLSSPSFPNGRNHGPRPETLPRPDPHLSLLPRRRRSLQPPQISPAPARIHRNPRRIRQGRAEESQARAPQGAGRSQEDPVSAARHRPVHGDDWH